MGFWDTLKGIGGSIGDIGRVAAPFLGAINPLLGIGVGAASGALGKLNDKGGLTLGSGLGGALGGGAMGGLGALAQNQGWIGKIAGLGGAATGGGGDPGIDALPMMGNTTTPGGGGTPQAGLLDKILGYAKSNPGMILGGGLGIMNALETSKRNRKIDARDDARYEMEREQFEGARPVRGLLNKSLMKPPPEPVDYTDQFSDLGNPFTRQRLGRLQ